MKQIKRIFCAFVCIVILVKIFSVVLSRSVGYNEYLDKKALSEIYKLQEQYEIQEIYWTRSLNVEPSSAPDITITNAHFLYDLKYVKSFDRIQKPHIYTIGIRFRDVDFKNIRIVDIIDSNEYYINFDGRVFLVTSEDLNQIVNNT